MCNMSQLAQRSLPRWSSVHYLYPQSSSFCFWNSNFLFFLSLSPPVVSRLTSGAAVDRHEGDRQWHTSVFNLLDTTRDRRAEEERTGATTVQHGQEGKEEEDDDGYDYYESDDEMSGDYDMDLPRGKAGS